MSTLWTSEEAAEATRGRATAPFSATGLSIDSRTIAPGDLFIPLKDQRDGHEFVADALAKGAAAAIVSRVPQDIDEGAPLLIVKDVQSSLEALARAARHRSRARVVAVTGSAGKTSTKDMLKCLLSAEGRTHAALASYNNHWGVPLTLAQLPKDAEFAVIEIGMNHPGEIEPLARLAAPDVAVITTVAAAHLEAFEDVAAIAREKASIFNGLAVDGRAIYNADVPTAAILRKAAGPNGRSFGAAEGSDYRALDITFHENVTVVRALMRGTNLIFKVSASGRHLAMNALGALSVIDALELDLALAATTLPQWMPMPGRGARERVVLSPDDPQLFAELIDDSFNANPASMAAGLDVLARAVVSGHGGDGRRIAILGDMLELGPEEMALHAAIAEHPALAEITTIHCVGERMRALHDVLPTEQKGLWVASADEMSAGVGQLIDAGDVILVKGSKSSHVSRVVDAIRKLGHRLQDSPVQGVG